MQQINPTALRVAATQRWDLNKIPGLALTVGDNPGDIWRTNLVLRRALARYGCFVLHSYYYRADPLVTNAVIVYYRYFQRARLVHYLSRIVRRGDAVLAPPFARLYLGRRLSALSASSKYLKVRWLKIVWQHRRRAYRGWGDLETLYLQPLEILQRRTIAHSLQHQLSAFTGTPVRVSLYNINQFISTINPQAFTAYYIFKRYSKFQYLYDLVNGAILATRFNTASLLSHILALGIEKHEAKRRQKKFLRMFERVLSRILSWQLIDRKPFSWRISVYGRLDAKIRRQHILIKVGGVQYQFAGKLISYSLSTAKSKYGTASVRVWIRNLIHWK